MVFHVLNRAVGTLRLFEKDADYAAFERVLAETVELVPMRVCAYCVMPEHWHLVLWPQRDGDVARFMQRLTLTHVRRWQEHRRLSGSGHLYRGRYRSFPVQPRAPFLAVARYVEASACRARLVRRAQQWRWSSLWRRLSGTHEQKAWLAAWPGPFPADWARRLNRPQTEAELEAIRISVRRGRPFGAPGWQRRTAKRLGLEPTFHPPGRPPRT